MHNPKKVTKKALSLRLMRFNSLDRTSKTVSDTANVVSVNGAENSTSHLVLETTLLDTVDNVSNNNIISQNTENIQAPNEATS